MHSKRPRRSSSEEQQQQQLNDMLLPKVAYPAYSHADCQALQRELKIDEEEIAQRCYTARLIGRHKSLVMHGGGNSSVKLVRADMFGQEQSWLAVKGSGYDQASIVPRGFPLVRLDVLRRMCLLPGLADDAMVNAFRCNLRDASSPTPSVEALLHALIPDKFVDHSHASAVVALACQSEPTARDMFQRAFAGQAELERVCIVPYVMPGFDLALAAKRVLEENPGCTCMILLKHGLFTWGATAQESYERHVLAVSLCEQLIAASSSSSSSSSVLARPPPVVSADYYTRFASTLRGVLSRADGGGSGGKWIVSRRHNPLACDFLHSPHCQLGCCTPDHVIRTKRVPLIVRGIKEEEEQDDAALEALLRDHVAGYVREYEAYFARHAGSSPLRQLDALPRVLLVENVGLVTVGRTFAETQISADIYEESIRTIASAVSATGEYAPCTPEQVFAVEYWVLEQAKLGSSSSASSSAPLRGHVCLITGGASGIGLECAKQFASKGCEVFVVDRDVGGGAASAVADVTRQDQVRAAFAQCCERFGGVDICVSNAGVFKSGEPVWTSDGQARREMDDSMQINFSSHHLVACEAVSIMRRQQTGGSVLFNVSKAPLNPGPRAGAYAVAKAATGALMRQLALECGEMGITSNAVNADRVRTNLFDLDLVASRASARNLSVNEYFSANLLRSEVTTRDVTDAFVFLAQAKKTTGTYVCVDGGCLASAPK